MHMADALVSPAVIGFVARVRPESLMPAAVPAARMRRQTVLSVFLATAVVLGGAVSWLASTRPDGLEWSLARAGGGEERAGEPSATRAGLAAVQERTAILPDYGFRERSGPAGPPGAAPGAVRWPAVNAGASVSGLVGGALTLLLAGAVGSALRRIRRA